MIAMQEKLAAVEQLIVELRALRNDKQHPMHWTLGALKEIARDLRAAEPAATTSAILELERRVMAIKKNGSTTDRLNQLAHEFMARWPVIRRALLAIEKEAPRETR